MIFQQNHYAEILPRHLDQLLAEGWYRRGLKMFTTYFVTTPEGIFDAPWLRLGLTEHRLRKRLRQMKRKNDSEFEIRVSQAEIDDEKRDLTLRYREKFKGEYYDDLDSVLYGDLRPRDLFNTQQVEVFKDGNLIAFSYFDLGETSVASIAGIYDPDYSRHSLGIYTMLLEIAWCRDQGFQFYYPGYGLPGNSRFDYKLRVGELDFLNPKSGQWIPWTNYDPRISPLAELRFAITKAKRALSDSWTVSCYFNYESPCRILTQTRDLDFPKYPLLLAEKDFIEGGEEFLAIEFDMIQRKYRLSRFRAIQALPFPYHKEKLEFFAISAPFDIANLLIFGSMPRKEVLAESADILFIRDLAERSQ